PAPSLCIMIVCTSFLWSRLSPIFLVALLCDFLSQHVSHRPLRSVLSAPCLPAPTLHRIHSCWLSYAVALPDRAAPDHAWLYHRVLGHAADDDGASSFRRCHARLHSGRASIRRAGPDEYPRRSLQGLPARGIDAGSNPETQIVPPP